MSYWRLLSEFELSKSMGLVAGMFGKAFIKPLHFFLRPAPATHTQFSSTVQGSGAASVS